MCAEQTYYPDVDHDGYGDASGSAASCEPMAGYITRGGDCRDDDRDIRPDAVEICDEVDNNCNNQVDDADPNVNASTGSVFYRDADGDTFGTVTQTREACAAPEGFVTTSTDCDDALAAVNPNALEVCDQDDNDCDNLVDGADPSVDLSTATSYYRDQDGDQFGAGTAMVTCSAPVGYVAANGDCNDSNNAVKPGGVEICDGADNDCDGGNDGTAAAPNRCAALLGTYAGSYSLQATEKVGTTIVNQMTCAGTGSGSLAFNRTPQLQGTFSCTNNGNLSLFQQNQSVTLRGTVALDGTVTATLEHTYNSSTPLRRSYTTTGTLTSSTLTLNGTGSLLPHPMSAVPWEVIYSMTGSN